MSNFLWPQKLPKRLPCRNECSWKSKWFPKYWMIGKSGHDTRRWWMSNPGASPNGLDSSSVIPSPGEERDCHTFGTKVENKEVHVCFPNANRFYFSWWKSQFCTTSSVGGKCMYTLFKDLTLGAAAPTAAAVFSLLLFPTTKVYSSLPNKRGSTPIYFGVKMGQNWLNSCIFM